MKTTYRNLAGLIAVLVVVQAASIAYGTFAISHAVDNGTTINKDSNVGDAGFGVHGITGMLLIPLLAIILVAISFRAPVPTGRKWAGFVLLAVVVQVGLGFVSHSVPALGWLHGVNAFVLLWVAVTAARLPASDTQAQSPPPASA
jgi:heme A synthase